MIEDNNSKVTKSFPEIIKAYRVQGSVPVLKEEIFKTIDTIELTSDILDLFTVQFGCAKATLLEQLSVTQNEDDIS